MKRNLKTYNGISSILVRMDFRFMPFSGVDFLIKKLSNYLHISKLFLSLSLSLFSLSLSERQTQTQSLRA